MEDREKKLKFKIPVVLILSVLLMKVLDWGLMTHLYFWIPNELEWDTSPWYNFLKHKDSIPQASNEKGTPSVIVMGSSVAMYSVLPSHINEDNANYSSYLYSHVAMAPTDAYYYKEDVLSKNPRLVVYVLNPADFQMEFLDEKDGDLFFNEEEWLRHFSWRHPARIIYPFSFSVDYLDQLKKNEIYRLWGKAFLFMNRYREFFWDPIDAYVERHFRRGRSYHIYTGSVPLEGIWQHGWTRQKFSLMCHSLEKTRMESIYIPESPTTITIRYGNGSENKITFDKVGWHSIELAFAEGISLQPIQIESDKVYSSRLAENKPYGKEYEYGIRLSQNFCSDDFGRDFSYIRPNYLEEERFRELSIKEYEEDYFERIYRDSDNRPELSRMKALDIAKKRLNQSDFFTWKEIDHLSLIRNFFEEKGIPFLVVLSPENPLELKKYSKGRWYGGLLDYLGESSQGHFYDFSAEFKDPCYFSDPHHLTYEGADKFSQILKTIIDEEISHEK